MIFRLLSGICNCLFLLYPSEIISFSCSFLLILFSGMCNCLSLLYLPIRDHAILMQLSSPFISCILLRFFTWWVDTGLGIQSFVLSLLQDIYKKHNVVFTTGASFGICWGCLGRFTVFLASIFVVNVSLFSEFLTWIHDQQQHKHFTICVCVCLCLSLLWSLILHT